jgi:hypothetical protein
LAPPEVPADLGDHFAPKTHLTSLQTADPKEAFCRVRKEAVRLDEEFAAIRRLRAESIRDNLSDADIQRLAALRFREQVESDESPAKMAGAGRHLPRFVSRS